MFLLFFWLLFFIIKVFFAWSFYQTYVLIPKQYVTFPAWISWLILLPVVGYVFEWMLLPFGLPFALEHYQTDNVLLQNLRRQLFGLGLAYVIITLTALFTFGLSLLISLILLVLYWVNVVKVRRYIAKSTMPPQP